MQIFNTLTRQKEEFVPQVPGEYRIYVCGPTVYNYIHIGNARPLIVFDTLRRYLEYRGNKVIYVSNITDIDDKLIKKGQEEGTSMKEVAPPPALMWTLPPRLLPAWGMRYGLRSLTGSRKPIWWKAVPSTASGAAFPWTGGSSCTAGQDRI